MRQADTHCHDGLACLALPFLSESWRETCFAAPVAKGNGPLKRAISLCWCPEEDSVTQARPRHPPYRMPFDSWREACFAVPGTKQNGPLMRAMLLCWCPEEDSVTQARPRHWMPFESWREACFAVPGTKQNGPLMRAMLLTWCPEEDSNLHTLRHTDLNRARLPIPPSGHYC